MRAAHRARSAAVPARVAALVSVGVVAAAAGWIATRSLQQDFAAYYTAAAATAHGLDPYVNHLGAAGGGGPWDGVGVYRHSRFLYPPLVAFALRPLAALPYAWAKFVFTALSVVGLFAGLRLATAPSLSPSPRARSARDDAPTSERGLLIVVALLPALWLPVFAALERGQTDLVVLPLLAAAWRWRHRAALAGFLLASCAMTKPLVLGVIPLLVIGRQRRWAVATLAALALYAGANLALAGRARCVEYLRDVVPRAALYGEGGPDELLLEDATLAPVSADLDAGIARIDGRGRAYEQEIGAFARNASLPRVLADRGATSGALALLILAALTAVLARGARRAPDRASWYWGGLVAAVLAAPVSWAMSLVWALPILALAVAPDDDAPAPTGLPSAALPVLVAATIAAAASSVVFAPGWILAGAGAVVLAVLLAVPVAGPTTAPTRVVE